MTKPFFSIVIPTYNPKEFISVLLTSISHNECTEEIEIIISDDCSTEPFDEIIEQFSTLNIRKISNEKHYGFPRNGRQHGMLEAKGIWLCFADQDDYFIDNAFDRIKQFITENKVKNYLVGDFIQENVDIGNYLVIDGDKGWTHGKFYEKSFLDKYEIRYGDVEYCEDISLSSRIGCLLITEMLESYKYQEPVYVWRRRHDSLCDDAYFVLSLPDYVKATLGVTMEYLEKYKEDPEKLGMFNVKFINNIFHVYFYFQSRLLNNNKQLLLRTVEIIQPLYSRFKEINEFTNEAIIEAVGTELVYLFNDTRHGDCIQIPFIEQITFKDWLNLYFD